MPPPCEAQEGPTYSARASGQETPPHTHALPGPRRYRTTRVMRSLCVWLEEGEVVLPLARPPSGGRAPRDGPASHLSLPPPRPCIPHLLTWATLPHGRSGVWGREDGGPRAQCCSLAKGSHSPEGQGVSRELALSLPVSKHGLPLCSGVTGYGDFSSTVRFGEHSWQARGAHFPECTCGKTLRQRPNSRHAYQARSCPPSPAPSPRPPRGVCK